MFINNITKNAILKLLETFFKLPSYYYPIELNN